MSYPGHSLVRGFLPLCREAVGVFYSPSRLGCPGVVLFIAIDGSVRLSILLYSIWDLKGAQNNVQSLMQELLLSEFELGHNVAEESYGAVVFYISLHNIAKLLTHKSIIKIPENRIQWKLRRTNKIIFLKEKKIIPMLPMALFSFLLRISKRLNFQESQYIFIFSVQV